VNKDQDISELEEKLARRCCEVCGRNPHKEWRYHLPQIKTFLAMMKIYEEEKENDEKR
jgi:hypothetical protein